MRDQPQIAGFEFERELGRGAHSVVYRARFNGIACAVKLPRAKARWSRWIYREAVALARVKHSGLPEVLEVGEVDGLPYLAMELVEGETLADHLERGMLEEETILDIAEQLTAALSAVHTAGLVHRDVKPRNIVLSAETNQLKLVDFGFATPMERVGTGETAGTAAYAAPEQLVPAGEIDGRTDLFAVGRLLFEAVSQPLASRLAGGPLGEAARLELIRQGVGSGLATIIGDLLRDERDERYPDAFALGEELALVRQGLPPLGAAAYPSRRLDGRVVGRDHELERIMSRVRDLKHGGGLVLVAGSRGTGKTQILRAAEAELAKLQVETLRVMCRQDDPPLATLRRIVDGLLSQYVSGGLLEPARAAIGNLASIVHTISPEQGRALSSVTPSEASANLPASDALSEGAAEILLRLANLSPIVLIVDDAQWLDPVSADVLGRLGHRSSEAPIAIVIAGRRIFAGSPLERYTTIRPGHTVQVELGPLDERQVHALIASHLGVKEVESALLQRIVTIAGGTPLGVFEVLGAFLDGGVLRPHARAWHFDAVQAERVVLPRGAVVLLGRRLGELPAATLRVLEMSAIVGATFDDAVVAQAMGLRMDDIAVGFASSRRAGLVEADAHGRHRFVHDSLRELLVEDLPEAERRRLHQRVAEVLDGITSPSFEELCAAALHYAAGETERDPKRVYRVARAASDAALVRFDNETAIRFHEQAERAADLAGIAPDAQFYRARGEAYLRIGLPDESERAFNRALEVARSSEERAAIFGRLAWVFQTRADPDRAWSTLRSAFAALGERLPEADLGSAVSTSTRLARMRVGRALHRESYASTDLLCALHYQNARLGLEYAKPAQLLQSGLQSLELSERASSLETRARAHAFHALVLAALGRKTAAAKSLAISKDYAKQQGDASTMAFCTQLHAIVGTFLGDLDLALVRYRECIDIYGPWIELNEYCEVIASAETIQSLRGRSNDAWSWTARAIERVRRSRVAPVVEGFIVHRARAGLAATGRDAKDDPWLTELLRATTERDAGQGLHRLASWGPRARYYLEVGDLGNEFEELVKSFEAEGHKAKTVHLVVSEYYVSIAHARIHQCLRSPIGSKARHIEAVRKASADLTAAAKVPLLKAHAELVAAALAWFEGHEKKSRKLLAHAEALANQQSAPWVLYGIARLRAHMLRAAGTEEAARDQARVAELLAREHGAGTRARWIREEFALVESAVDTPTAIVSSRHSSSSRTNRQLAALLQVVTAPRRDLKAEQQGAAILDELVGLLRAERGMIWFDPEQGVPGIAIARHRSSQASVSISPESARGGLLREVHRSGRAWPPTDGAPFDAQPFDPSRVVALPLSLYEKLVGALCVERGPEDPPFDADDRSLLQLLSHQVPIALEIARLLFEREQLHASLQHAKKMEAMGALAGGLAHDFNNMLAAMRVALSAAQERATLDAELTIELDIISQATTRAAQLTSQLLSFSRHQPVPVAVHDINQLVSTLEPMLRRVVGVQTNIQVKLSPAVDAVEVDQGSFDQAIVNLLINARDAMPKGGTVTISTRNVVLGESAAQRANLSAGEYVEIEVADTGQGMSQETMTRIFEPFFTTKPVGSGSGLGLAMVYAFARNCGGSIEVSSEVGQGTQFRIYLKRVVRNRTSRPARSSLPSKSAVAAAPISSDQIRQDGPDTILVVDDDDLVRRSIAKILERNGYRVLAASGSAEALNVAREQGRRIALVILDVLMPGVTGPELGRRLDALNLGAKVLFVSGFSPESIPLEEAQVAADMLLQKPFSQTTLLERVRQLMQ